MAGIFDGVYGAQFPDVVMNSGPLPSEGGLPAPLHDTPDARINYNSTLLGDIEPYAYGEPAYLSTQQSYLNIPHRIQKILPVIYLPEPKGHSTFRLSHSIDDGDIAFSLRLNKSSVFCTGSRTATRKNALGTAVEPFINLPTLNYILAGIQKISDHDHGGNLWKDFLHALDSSRFPLQGNERDYQKNKLDLQDLIYVVRECIRPFGIMRGSEKQGGQNEMTDSPATWPVPFVTTLVIDGREDHVVNMWHNMDVDAGEDLVLRFKPMPIPETYTLNHYYKQPMQKSFDKDPQHTLVWQLVPDKMSYNIDDSEYEYVNALKMPEQFHFYKLPKRQIIDGNHKVNDPFKMINISALRIHWQELGYWHIGRTQIRLTKYVTDDSSYYHNDMVNMLRSQYMLLTFEPVFQKLPLVVNEGIHKPEEYDTTDHGSNFQMMSEIENKSKLVLGKTQTLDSFFTEEAHKEEENEWTFVSTAAASSSVIASTPAAADDKKTKRRKITSGAVIHPDGSTEAQTIQTL